VESRCTAIKDQSLWNTLRKDARVELSERRRESFQVLRITRGGYVGVRRETREALETRRESTDQHVVHTVLRENASDPFGIEGRGLRHAGPRPRIDSRCRPPATDPRA
jgi:hypothetical protein